MIGWIKKSQEFLQFLTMRRHLYADTDHLKVSHLTLAEWLTNDKRDARRHPVYTLRRFSTRLRDHPIRSFHRR